MQHRPRKHSLDSSPETSAIALPGKHSGKKCQLRTILPSLVLFAGLLAAPAASRADIAVTLPPLAGLVAMLDNSAKTFCLLPAGPDPHHFQISPRRAEQLKRADLLIRTPGADAGWPLPPDDAKTLRLWPEQNHAWLVPDAVAGALPKIAASLITLYPGQEAEIRRQLTAALDSVHTVDVRWKEALAPLARHGVIMQHPSWKPLMEAAGVPVLAVLESPLHGHEEGPHMLEEALAVLKDHPDAWLIGDSRHSNRSLEWLARHAGHPVRLVYLDALGDCGTGWETLMLDNLDKLSSDGKP